MTNISIGMTETIQEAGIIWLNNSVFFVDEMNFTIVPIFPLCKILDFHNYIDFGASSPLRIYFKIKKTEDLALTLYLDERVRRVKRALKSLHHSYTGQDMETTITNLLIWKKQEPLMS